MTINTFKAGKLTTQTVLPSTEDVIKLGKQTIQTVSALADSLKIADNLNKIFFLTVSDGEHPKNCFYKLAQKNGNYEFITLEEDNKSDTIFTFADGSQYAKQESGILRKSYLTARGWYDSTTNSYLSSITDVQFGNTLTAIDASLLSGCTSLTAISIPSSINKINTGAFRQTSIYSIEIPGTISNIASICTTCSNLSSIILNEGIQSIANWSFSSSAVKELEFPYTLTTLSNSVFQSCAQLANVHFKENLSSIGSQTFYKCTSLSSVTFEGNAPTVETNAFKDVASDCKAYVHSTATGFPAEGEQWNGLTIAYIENT